MSFGITPTGFVIKDFDVLRQELINLIKAIISPNLDERVTNPLIQHVSIAAAQFQRLENIMLDLYGNIFIITATGPALDAHAADKGLTRQLATKSSGNVTVAGSPASVITSGAVFSTSGDNATQFESQQRVEIGQTTETFIGSAVDNFQLTSQATGSFGTNQIIFIKNTSTPWSEVSDNPPLNDLEFYVDYADPTTIVVKNAVLTTDLITITFYDDATTSETVPVRASVAGTIGNVGSNTINVIVTPLSGITSVINSASMTGGTDEEEDDALRIRLLNVSLANWTEADLKSLLEDIEGVRTVDIDDGLTIQILTNATQSGGGPYDNTLALTAQRGFRAKFYDKTADTTVDWILTSGVPTAGQYRILGPTTTIEYGTLLETDDTLTVTYMDNDVGTGVFNVNVIGDSNPITSELTDTILSTLTTKKPFGVAPFVIQPDFINLRITVTTVLAEGFALVDVSTEIQDGIGTLIAANTIGQDVIHYAIIDIVMDVEGITDVTSVNYQIIDESVIKGLPDAIDPTFLAPTSLIGATILDDQGNSYDLNAHYQYHATGIDWSIGARQIDAFKLLDITGGGYTDYTTEANSAAGSIFDMWDADPEVGDYSLVGQDEKFNKITYDIVTPGDGDWIITPYYWNGSGWSACANVVDGTINAVVGSGTSSFTQDGSITFNNPQTDWAITTIDTVSAYWIKLEITSSSAFNTTPTCESVRTDREPVKNSVYFSSYALDDNTNIVVPDTAIAVEESTVVL